MSMLQDVFHQSSAICTLYFYSLSFVPSLDFVNVGGDLSSQIRGWGGESQLGRLGPPKPVFTILKRK